MATGKVLIFAPADADGETHRQLEQAGCDLVLGKASWQTPMGDNEDEMAALATGADALVGTSIRSSPRNSPRAASSPPITRRFCVRLTW
jgi:hypothetical protein